MAYTQGAITHIKRSVAAHFEVSHLLELLELLDRRARGVHKADGLVLLGQVVRRRPPVPGGPWSGSAIYASDQNVNTSLIGFS